MQVKIHVKKIAVDVDNFPNYSEKRYQMICQIQGFLKEGCSYREIVRRMGVGRNTIAKYRNGNPMELSMYGVRQSKLDPYYDFIVQCLKSGWSKSKTVKAVYEKGYTGSLSNAFDYLVKIEEKINEQFAPQPYVRTMTEALKYRTGSCGKDKDYITKQIYWFCHLSFRSFIPSKRTVTMQYPYLISKLTNEIKQIDGWDYELLKGIGDKLWFL